MIELKDKLNNSKPHINTNPSMPEAVERDLSDKLIMVMVRGLKTIAEFELETCAESIAEIKFDYFRRSSHENGI